MFTSLLVICTSFDHPWRLGTLARRMDPCILDHCIGTTRYQKPVMDTYRLVHDPYRKPFQFLVDSDSTTASRTCRHLSTWYSLLGSTFLPPFSPLRLHRTTATTIAMHTTTATEITIIIVVVPTPVEYPAEPSLLLSSYILLQCPPSSMTAKFS